MAPTPSSQQRGYMAPGHGTRPQPQQLEYNWQYYAAINQDMNAGFGAFYTPSPSSLSSAPPTTYSTGAQQQQNSWAQPAPTHQAQAPSANYRTPNPAQAFSTGYGTTNRAQASNAGYGMSAFPAQSSMAPAMVPVPMTTPTAYIPTVSEPVHSTTIYVSSAPSNPFLFPALSATASAAAEEMLFPGNWSHTSR
ncbi:hypothetical protein BROUX41_002468 [Berkeleyomyces rouxiae]|uniref:uncharacterized protein n=1 Tax=Berkeleyomyces rouxiae TaxID=2035830 RepID=UPI003B812E12